MLSFDVTNDATNLSSLVSLSTTPLSAASTTGPVVPSETSSTTTVLGNTTDPLDPENDGNLTTSDNSSAPDSNDPAFPSGPDDPVAATDNSTAQSNIAPIPHDINGIPTVANGTESMPSGNASVPPPDSATFNDTDDGGNVPYTNASTPPPEYAIFNDTTPDQSAPLNCPCNCTYVSAACCLSGSGIVYEDPSMQIHMDPLPANATVCCNERTGHWLWRSSGGCSSAVLNGTASDFINIGNVKWNNTFSNNVGFPDPDEDNT